MICTCDLTLSLASWVCAKHEGPLRNCNFWYAGPSMISPGDHRLKCACGLFVQYEGEVLFYSNREDPQHDLRALTAQLEALHDRK